MRLVNEAEPGRPQDEAGENVADNRRLAQPDEGEPQRHGEYRDDGNRAQIGQLVMGSINGGVFHTGSIDAAQTPSNWRRRRRKERSPA